MMGSLALEETVPAASLSTLAGEGASRAPANDCAARSQGQGAARVDKLYREHAAAIHARCRRLVGDADGAADLTQETFIRAARHAERLPPGREALAWLYRVATNLCLNDLRDRRTARAATAAFGECAVSTVAGPEGAVSDRELVRRVLEPLPEKVRAAALLRHVDGLHDAEVAAALGVGRRTVVYRLTAFREKAARRLSVT
jgi:RNA polymerase sigma-70 factor (ECF subfamily)